MEAFIKISSPHSQTFLSYLFPYKVSINTQFNNAKDID